MKSIEDGTYTTYMVWTRTEEVFQVPTKEALYSACLYVASFYRGSEKHIDLLKPPEKALRRPGVIEPDERELFARWMLYDQSVSLMKMAESLKVATDLADGQLAYAVLMNNGLIKFSCTTPPVREFVDFFAQELRRVQMPVYVFEFLEAEEKRSDSRPQYLGMIGEHAIIRGGDDHARYSRIFVVNCVDGVPRTACAPIYGLFSDIPEAWKNAEEIKEVAER